MININGRSFSKNHVTVTFLNAVKKKLVGYQTIVKIYDNSSRVSCTRTRTYPAIHWFVVICIDIFS
jgi:hypothetical protein